MDDTGNGAPSLTILATSFYCISRIIVDFIEEFIQTMKQVMSSWKISVGVASTNYLNQLQRQDQ
jgi:hypothetical protein